MLIIILRLCEGGTKSFSEGQKICSQYLKVEYQHIVFSSAIKSAKFTRTVDAYLKGSEESTIDIACTLKVPTAGVRALKLS